MRPVLLLLLVLACAPASAELYRCGNQFQDRPCDSAALSSAKPPPGAAADSYETRASKYAAQEERKKAYGRYECARYDQEIRNIYEAQDLKGQNMEQLNARARAVEAARGRAGCD